MGAVADKFAVGFIGIGKMGLPMASRVTAAGYPVHAYDVSAVALKALCDRGTVHASKSPAAVGEAAEVIILMLSDSRVVEKVLFDGNEGLAARLAPGKIVVDMSSSNPTATVQMGAKLHAAGVGFIDAPVSGGVKRALDGSLAIMAGGDAGTIERVRPLLSTMGKSIIETGKLGSGHAMKALNNYVSAAGLVAACEALKAGSAFGIAPDKVVAVLNASTGRNNSTENKLMQFVVSGAFDSGFTLGLMRKDVNIATDLARTLRSPMLLGEALLGSWKDAEAKLGGASDHTEIYRMLDSSHDGERR